MSKQISPDIVHVNVHQPSYTHAIHQGHQEIDPFVSQRHTGNLIFKPSTNWNTLHTSCENFWKKSNEQNNVLSGMKTERSHLNSTFKPWGESPKSAKSISQKSLQHFTSSFVCEPEPQYEYENGYATSRTCTDGWTHPSARLRQNDAYSITSFVNNTREHSSKQFSANSFKDFNAPTVPEYRNDFLSTFGYKNKFLESVKLTNPASPPIASNSFNMTERHEKNMEDERFGSPICTSDSNVPHTKVNNFLQDTGTIQSCRVKPIEYPFITQKEIAFRQHVPISNSLDIKKTLEVKEENQVTHNINVTNFSMQKKKKATNPSHGLHVNLVPMNPRTRLPVFRESYHIILNSLKDVTPIYNNENGYNFSLKIIHFPTRSNGREPIMTQMIGPFSSTPSSNQLTVECDLKKSLIELPYIGGMELRVAIFQTYGDCHEFIGRARVHLHTTLEHVHSEYAPLVENEWYHVEKAGSFKGNINLSVFGHMDPRAPFSSLSDIPQDNRVSISKTPGPKVKKNMTPTHYGTKRGFLSHAVFSLFNNIFPERSYPKQTGSIPTSPNAWRHQKNFGNFTQRSLSVFCMDLPETLSILLRCLNHSAKRAIHFFTSYKGRNMH